MTPALTWLIPQWRQFNELPLEVLQALRELVDEIDASGDFAKRYTHMWMALQVDSGRPFVAVWPMNLKES